MLLRMYVRWTERKGFKREVMDLQPGDEAGIKSATLTITGDYASRRRSYELVASAFGLDGYAAIGVAAARRCAWERPP